MEQTDRAKESLLRLPKRARGLILGLTTLFISPLVASLITGTLVAGRPAAAGVPAPTIGQVDRVVHSLPMPLLALRLHAPFPPPPPPPAPAAPAPKPARPAFAVPAFTGSKATVAVIIEAAAARWGVNGAWMVRIAMCESGLRPNAVNPRGPYLGLFQFLTSTFTHNGGTNIWDATDQANIAAKMLAHGQAHQWSCA